MRLRWWEKTVEYQFVLEVSGAERLFLAPLDGRHEAAGDASISANNRWVLIEFKRDYDAIIDEQRKFDPVEFADAKADLGKDDRHHLIVYGSLGFSQNKQKLKLLAQRYFSGFPVDGDMSAAIAKGMELEAFNNYVKRFVEFKKVTSGSSGGGLDYSMVAGVTLDGNVVETISLSEFARQIEPALVQEQSRSRGFDGPGR